MKKVLGWMLILGVSMYFFPQIWYFLIALMLGIFVFLMLAICAVFVAKALGFTALELWIARTVLRKKKHT